MDEKTLNALKECLDKTPNDAVKYLKSLGIEISWDWKEQLDIIKRHSFTVAKVMNADILQDILDELIKAAEEGKTFKEFKEDLKETLVLAGYVHDKGSSWRLDTIYRTNMQTAFMAGRFEQMKSVVDVFPFWQYIAVMDIRTRPHHAAMHGKVFKADDSIWLSWYPPNGFACRCRITALDDSTLERKNLSVSDGKDVKVKPDEGFARAPGFVDYVPETKKYADPIREKLADILEKSMKFNVKKE
jgi:SPP1 gp7 family putative phage head morphogenesis protein